MGHNEKVTDSSQFIVSTSGRTEGIHGKNLWGLAMDLIYYGVFKLLIIM